MIQKNSPSSRSVLEMAHARLRSILIKSEVGAHLGSESDMAQQIGVSLPTFRQVARVLEQEQLLEIKRGKQGGLYVRRPSLDIVVETASLFLYFEESTVRDLIVTSSILSAEAARSSASAPLDLRQKVFQEIHERSQTTGNQAMDDFKRDEWLMMECLAKTCANKAVSLFLHTTQHVSMMRYAEWSVIDEFKMAAHKALRSRVIDAILIGDGEIASILRRRQLPLVLESIPEARLNSKIVTR